MTDTITTTIAEYSQIEAGLAVLREKYAGSVWVVDTTARMAAARKARADVKERRVELEAIRKGIKAPALERCRAIDEEAKRITRALRAIEDPIDASIKAEEERKEAEKQAKARAEEERIARARAEVDAIREPSRRLVGMPSSHIEEAGRVLFERDVTRSDEFSDEAAKAKAETLSLLRDMLRRAREAEAEAKRIAEERAELARLRAEQEAREAEARAQRAAEDAARKAIEKEASDKLAQAERESRERIAAQEREARLAREKADAEALEVREREASRLRVESERLEAEREATNAERRRIASEKLMRASARELLQRFAEVYGKRPEFSGVVTEIRAYFVAHPEEVTP